MDLLQFVEDVGGKELTEDQKKLMDEMRDMVRGYDIVIVDGRFSPLRTAGIAERLLGMDYKTVEDHILALQRKGRNQAEKTMLFGTNYTQCWFDEFEGIKTRNIPIREVYAFNMQEPADHPTRKREPKGPRGKWGKLK